MRLKTLLVLRLNTFLRLKTFQNSQAKRICTGVNNIITVSFSGFCKWILTMDDVSWRETSSWDLLSSLCNSLHVKLFFKAIKTKEIVEQVLNM